MKIKNILQHAWRMAGREFSTGEYRLTIFALIIGVTAVMSLSLTASRIERAMFSQASDMIGGDLVVRSTEWNDVVLEQNAAKTGLDSSLSVSTISMVGSNEEFLLSSIRAVDDNYPLKGQVTIKDGLQSQSVLAKTRPEPGTAWVDKRLLDRLNINIGDNVDVGYASLKITRIIEIEPDRGGNFYSFYPRLLFNRADLEQSQLIQPGSRAFYKFMLAGEPNEIDQWRNVSEPELQSNQRLVDPQSSQTRVSTNLERASAFINLGSLMSVILCGIAVSLAASRHARRHINQVALLRCFGLSGQAVNSIYCLQLLIIAIPAIVIGMISGYLIHMLLIQILSEFFTTSLPVATFKAWFSGPLTALSMVIGFGLPSIIQLAKTPPARVLRRELETTHRAPVLSGMLALACLTLIAWWQTSNLMLALMTVGGTIVLIAALLAIILLMLKLFSKRFIKNPLLRSAYSNLVAKPTLTAMQIAGFGLSTFAIVLIVLFRHDLFSQWNQEIPDNAPNRFVFDILDHDKPQFDKLLTEQNIQTDLYPIVRGRLTRINNEIVQQAVTKEDRDDEEFEEALERDLTLTQVPFLPKENVIVEGQFYTDINQMESGELPVSVESELVENLSLKLGDKLEFIVEGQSLLATIASVRTVNWENFNPNFYMLFPQGALDDYSRTWLTSYYLPPEQADFDNQISKAFPATTVIDVDFVIERIRRILDQVTAAMELIFSMTVMAGIAVFWAALLITFDEKQKQAALLRALGASRKNVSQRFICEQVLIGLFSGLLATLCLIIVSWLLSSKVLEIDWNFPTIYSIVVPIILMCLLSALASFQLRKIVQTSPQQILQRAETA